MPDETALNLPNIPGRKKLIYTHPNLPLTALSEFAEKGKMDSRFDALHEMVEKANELWNSEAEHYLLEHF